MPKPNPEIIKPEIGDQEIASEFWHQEIPESQEEKAAREILEEINWPIGDLDGAQPELTAKWYDFVSEKNASIKVGLTNIYQEMIKKIIVEETDEKELVAKILGFHGYTLSEPVKHFKPKTSDNMALDFRLSNLLRLYEKVGAEEALNIVNEIKGARRKFEDKALLQDRDDYGFFIDVSIDLLWKLDAFKAWLEKNNEFVQGDFSIITEEMKERYDDPRRKEIVDDPSTPQEIKEYILTEMEYKHEIYDKYQSEMEEFYNGLRSSEQFLESIDTRQPEINVALVDLASLTASNKKWLDYHLSEMSGFNTDCDAYKSIGELGDDKNYDLIVLGRGVTDEDIKNIKMGDKKFIVVALSDNENNDEKKLSSGADMIIPNASYHRSADIIRHVGKILTENNELKPKDLEKEKEKFYNEVADIIKERQDVTADTEQELEILKNIIDEYFDKGKISLVDAGCGYGRLAIPLAEDGHNVIGIDLSEKLLQEFDAKLKEKNLEATTIHGSLTKLPLQEKTQDMMMFNWHVFCDLAGEESKLAALHEAYHTLKPDGVITLDIPDRKKLKEFQDGYYIDKPEGKEVVYRGYIPKIAEMEKWLYETGFKNAKIKAWETKNGYPKITITAEKK